MKIKVINLYDKSKAIKVTKCGQTLLGSDRLVKMREKLHNKSCDVCKKQNK
jgi:hypothetical protein